MSILTCVCEFRQTMTCHTTLQARRPAPVAPSQTGLDLATSKQLWAPVLLRQSNRSKPTSSHTHTLDRVEIKTDTETHTLTPPAVFHHHNPTVQWWLVADEGKGSFVTFHKMTGQHFCAAEISWISSTPQFKNFVKGTQLGPKKKKEEENALLYFWPFAALCCFLIRNLHLLFPPNGWGIVW